MELGLGKHVLHVERNLVVDGDINNDGRSRRFSLFCILSAQRAILGISFASPSAGYSTGVNFEVRLAHETTCWSSSEEQQ